MASALPGELAQHEQGRLFERNAARCAGGQADLDVREAGVPAGVIEVVEDLILGIPAEDHVAEAKSGLQGRDQLVAVHVFAAHDSVDVEHPDLERLERIRTDQVDQGLGREVGQFRHQCLPPMAGGSPASACRRMAP